MHVLARITFKPESANAARAILTRLATQSRREAGCISYLVFQQAAAPHVFQTVEEWRDAASADAHLMSPHVGAAFATAGPLLAGAPEILPYQQLS